MKLSILFAVIAVPMLHAQGTEEEKTPNQPAKPSVEKIDEDHLRIGGVTIDKKTREISFPAVVNLREGLLEFAVVHQNGKIHESLLRTDISPTSINLAFTLLRYKPSKELYRIPKEPGLLTQDYFKEPEETRKSARIRIFVELQKDGETKRIPINDWILHDTNHKAMPPTHWVYGGSEFYDGIFVPESTGDIIAVYLTNSTLVNYPGNDNSNDDVWSAFTDRIPELETKVTVVIAPFEEKP